MFISRRAKAYRQHAIPVSMVVSFLISGCLAVPDFRSSSELLDQDLGSEGDRPDEGREAFSQSCEERGELCLDVALTPLDMSVQDASPYMEDMQPNPSRFMNTQWVKFRNSGYLQADDSKLESLFGRMSNGTGEADAWSISLYMKSGDSTEPRQPILYYGAGDVESHHIALYWTGRTSDQGRRLIFTYGSNASHLMFQTPTNSVGPRSRWHHLMITYDGDLTGVNPEQLDDAYSRFKVFIDGAEQTLTTEHINYGTDAPLRGQLFQVGKHPTEGAVLSGFKIDEIAIWDSDQSFNISRIYDEEISRDLALLTAPPAHWWRLGDGDTFPTLSDRIGGVDLTMNQMVEGDIVSAAP